MTYSASIERIAHSAAVLRVHPEADGRVGDPYLWACTLAITSEADNGFPDFPTTAEFKGVCAPFPMAARHAVKAALWAAGIRMAFYRRRARPGRPLLFRHHSTWPDEAAAPCAG